MTRILLSIACICCYGHAAAAQEDSLEPVLPQEKSQKEAEPQENPSDPLAGTSSIDFRYRYYDLGGDAERNRYTVKGSHLLTSRLKLSYELNYYDTDSRGSFHSSLESAKLKLLRLARQYHITPCISVKWGYGVEWIKGLGKYRDGTSPGADQISPMVGASWKMTENGHLVTLVQYFYSYSKEATAPHRRRTRPRLIWVHNFPCYAMWLRVDDKFTIDHERNDGTSNVIEVQAGKNLNETLSLYIEGLYQTHGFQQYNWGVGSGLRITY